MPGDTSPAQVLRLSTKRRIAKYDTNLGEQTCIDADLLPQICIIVCTSSFCRWSAYLGSGMYVRTVLGVVVETDGVEVLTITCPSALAWSHFCTIFDVLEHFAHALARRIL